MNLTDPVADFLTRIRNSMRARHQKLAPRQGALQRLRSAPDPSFGPPFTWMHAHSPLCRPRVPLAEVPVSVRDATEIATQLARCERKASIDHSRRCHIGQAQRPGRQ